MRFAPSRRVLFAAIGLALVFAFAGAYRAGLVPWPGRGASEKTEETGGPGGEGRRDRVVTVTAGVARVADMPVTIDAVGTVQALNTVTIRTQVDGRLMKLAFTEGQDVRQGDVLAIIDPSLYQAQYDQAVAKKAQDEANLANARLDLARYQKLAAANFASQQQHSTQRALVAQLEAQVRADQAAIDNAKTTLDFATIRSPIDGRVGIRQVDVGNILHASDQTGIVVVTQLKPIYVVFTLPQQALPAVQKAQARAPAKAQALGPDNASVIETGEVAVIDNQIDQQTGTVRVKATFANPTLALWPGQFVNVRLVLDTIKDAIVVPSPAVQRGPSGAFVYLLGEDGVATLRPVTTGRQDESLAVIASGLEPGAKVITSGFSRLSDGAKTRLAEPAESAPGGAGPAGTEPPSALDKGQKPAGGERRRHGRGRGAG